MNIHGYITPNTSYGIITLDIIKRLEALGREPFVFPVKGAEFPQGFNSVIARMAGEFDYNAPCLIINHQYLMQMSAGKGERIGYTFFEMDQLTPYEVNSLNSLHKLIVPSNWAKGVCERSGVNIPVYVNPPGYDPQIFKLDNKCKKCVFLSVGKWEVRKDQDGIVDAFSKAFTHEDVELWMLMDNPFLAREFIVQKTTEYKSKLGNKLTVLPRVDSRANLASIINHSYCFVSNSKAEGANLPLLESLACGKFAISPCYSGESEFQKGFITTSHSGVELANDGKWFGVSDKINKGNWCKPSQDSIVENLRKVYQSFLDGVLTNEAGLEVAKEFTIDKHVERLLQIVGA